MRSISKWIESIDLNTIVSEQDVRTKIAAPLLTYLGYMESIQANEFPIYSFNGRQRNNPKLVDLICFASNDWINHKTRESKNWVQKNSLLSFELKKPSEKLDDAEGQAQFYSMNARTPFYMCTNGINIKIFRMKDYSVDEVIFNDDIQKLLDKWPNICNIISYEKLIELKKENIVREERIYLDYCVTLKRQYEDMYSWYWQQTAVLPCSEKEITLNEVIETTNNIVLVGKAGTGKTTYLHRVFIEVCKKYINNVSDVIPVFLSAKLWKRDFTSISEGIFSELETFIPSLTKEFLDNEIRNKRIFFLIDGIDECFCDRDILIHELNKFSSKTIASVRDNIIYEKLFDFTIYNLPILDEKRMIEIAASILKQTMDGQIYTMQRELKNILQTPIYFNMWLMYKLNNENSREPVNIAELYRSFTSYLLKQHVASKGIIDVNNINLNSLQNILSNFAYNLYELERPDIVKSISEIYPDSVQLIYKIFLHSGLIFETTDTCEFQQHSLKEYYYARYILDNEKKMERFLKEKSQNNNYEEIFLILIGLNKNLKIQNIILNYLLENNLSLYIKCLHRRYNFSTYIERNKDKEFYNIFFQTILYTYCKIIDLYFPKIKENFLPFCCLENYSEKMRIGMRCSVDRSTNSIGINIFAVENDSVSFLEITYQNNAPKILVCVDDKNIEMPYGIFKDTSGLFQYNLNVLGKGVDYAREIAIDMIYSNIETILKEGRLLRNEVPMMHFCFIEECLRNASPIHISVDDEKEYNLSLGKQNVEELLDVFLKFFSYRVPMRHLQNNFTFGLLWTLLYINKKNDVDFSKIIFPNKLDQPIGAAGWIWNYYCDDDIILWIKNYHEISQIAYREFVEKIFPELKDNLNYYQIGPIKYYIEIELPNRQRDDFFSCGSLSIRYHMVENISESDPLIKVVDKMDFVENESYLGELEKERIFFNRKNLNYNVISRCRLDYVLDSQKNIREFVYNKLKDDFKKMFNE
ncbi:MAG: NACHT domain-containing protein [Acidaminococcaceae bacterium]